MIEYGADPTGKTDSTDAILAAVSDAASVTGDGFLMQGITNLGGVRISLEGGIYKISRPIKLPVAGKGNIMVCNYVRCSIILLIYYYRKCCLTLAIFTTCLG